jgi:phosphate transport system substrate-binding protein
MKWRSVLSKAAALLVIAAAACQPAATPAPTAPAPVQAPTPTSPSAPAPAPTPSPARLSGEIKVDGSSTVYPITEAVGEEFQKLHPDVKVVVGISGTGGGFKKFCNGETDISNASRPILQKEIDTCAQNGIEYIELPVAYDALSVVVNPRNDWVACMTVAELKKIWEPDAQGKITRWNQVRPEWPDAPLNLYGAGTDSGTFDYFTEAIVGKAKASRGDYTASEDDNVLVQGVANDQYALGYFGLAYYFENQDKLKAVAIDNGKGCVLPSEETVRNGTYQPLSRPLFIYVSRKARIARRWRPSFGSTSKRAPPWSSRSDTSRCRMRFTSWPSSASRLARWGPCLRASPRWGCRSRTC